jgi:hypothetical protein
MNLELVITLSNDVYNHIMTVILDEIILVSQNLQYEFEKHAFDESALTIFNGVNVILTIKIQNLQTYYSMADESDQKDTRIAGSILLQLS